MKSGKYTLRELLADSDAEQFVIPELQRDYVWGKEQVATLTANLIKSFKDSKSRAVPDLYCKNGDSFKELPSVQKNTLQRLYLERLNRYNIGFIYAYYSTQIPGRYYLIDGQQRLTTIYLLLAFLAASSQECTAAFNARYFPQIQGLDPDTRRLKIDYRVREVSHEFLQNVISSIFDHSRLNDFLDDSSRRKLPWWRLYYEDDATACAITENLKTIREQCAGLSEKDKSGLFYFLEDNVDFWYFDTNQSYQGEELYLYMNSRGEQLSYNENCRSAYIRCSENKKEDGEKWDQIQNFFWTKRGNNPSADQGFDFFLHLCEFLYAAGAPDTAEPGGYTKKLTAFVRGDRSQYLMGHPFNSETLKIFFSYFNALQQLLRLDDPELGFDLKTENLLRADYNGVSDRDVIIFLCLLEMLKDQTVISETLRKNIKIGGCIIRNLMREREVEDNPSEYGQRLLSISNYFRTNNFEIKSMTREPDKLLSEKEESVKFKFLAAHEDLAEDVLTFLDEILEGNRILKGKIGVLLRSVIADGETVKNDEVYNVFLQENFDGIKENVCGKWAILDSKINNLPEVIGDLWGYGNYFFYYSDRGTRYPYTFGASNKSNTDRDWNSIIYYDGTGQTDTNPYIVQYLREGGNALPVEERHDYSQESIGLQLLSELFCKREAGARFLDSLKKRGKVPKFNIDDKKIRFAGGYTLPDLLSDSYQNGLRWQQENDVRELVVDYDLNNFKVSIKGTDKFISIPINKDGDWQQKALDKIIKYFSENGSLPESELSDAGFSNAISSGKNNVEQENEMLF